MSYLELKNVSFAYPNGYTAVEDVSMAFEKGEAVAIIGQNGAGKTTATIARKVGYVFQNPDDQIFQ